MAAQLYNSAATLFAKGLLDWTSGSWVLFAVAAGYTPNFATHAVLADVPGAQIIMTGAITGRSVVAGACLASPVVLAVPGGVAVPQLVIMRGTDLVWWANSGSNLPFISDGQQQTIGWDPSVGGPFKL